jgi:hypothetical protein
MLSRMSIAHNTGACLAWGLPQWGGSPGHSAGCFTFGMQLPVRLRFALAVQDAGRAANADLGSESLVCRKHSVRFKATKETGPCQISRAAASPNVPVAERTGGHAVPCAQSHVEFGKAMAAVTGRAPGNIA